MSEAETVPDLLDGLGLTIHEIGGVHLGVEGARRWPSGTCRTTLVLQAAYGGTVRVELSLTQQGGVTTTRQIALAHAEVRRVRIPLELGAGVTSLALKVKAPVPEGAQRIRQAWLPPRDAEGESVFGVLFGALRQAVGMRDPVVVPPARAERELTVEVEAAEGELPIVKEEEVVWQPGMEAPKRPELTVPAERKPPAPQPLATAEAAGTPENAGATAPHPAAPSLHEGKKACPRCGELYHVELISEIQRCPGCNQHWKV